MTNKNNVYLFILKEGDCHKGSSFFKHNALTTYLLCKLNQNVFLTDFYCKFAEINALKFSHHA